MLRHSGATRIALSLRRETERVRFAITDNGCGMPGEPAAGMGLGNMRDRARELPGGRFDLDTAPVGGTRVIVSFLVAESPVP